MKKKKDKSPSPAQSDRERNDALNKSKKDEEKHLPGDYSAKEDIMNRRDQQRVGLDVENFARAAGYEVADNINEPIVTSPVGGSRQHDNFDGDQRLANIDDAEQPDASDMERPVPKNLDLDEDNLEGDRSESDVTEEDMQALGPKDLSLDMGEDEQLLKNRVYPVDMAGDDLDIPVGEEKDDDLDEAIGPEDEENDFYSLGGDRLEDNMEGK